CMWTTSAPRMCARWRALSPNRSTPTAPCSYRRSEGRCAFVHNGWGGLILAAVALPTIIRCMKSAVFLSFTRRWPAASSWHTVLQIAAIIGIWWSASALTHTTGLALSPGVIGLLAVLALLLSGRVEARWIEDGAQWLLGELVLFFIPCVVA